MATQRLPEQQLKIGVAGLGLIGGSLALALRRAGHKVTGCNRSRAAAEYALVNGVIDEEGDVTRCDAAFVALPPAATVDFICSRDWGDTVVADICGVKGYVEERVRALRPDIKFVGAHPMAGKEVSGVQNACADLFDNASMVLTRNIYTDERAYGLIKRLVKDMGFKRLVECSAQVHDKKIAYTSQLAHVVSNCYVKDGEIEGCLGFTGGSFQDMTRIAGVDEELWAELYLINGQNLIKNIDNLVARLSEVSSALSAGDRATLVSLLKAGREQFAAGKNNSFQGRDITTTLLK